MGLDVVGGGQSSLQKLLSRAELGAEEVARGRLRGASGAEFSLFAFWLALNILAI
jgi:hypothetical protein